jgi:replicative DNA helicase
MDKKRVKQNIAATIAESVGDGTFKTKNVDVERKVLYQCFRKPSNLQTITANLTVDDFSDVRHKVFYKYISSSSQAGRLPDASICLATAKRSSEFEVDPEDYEEGMRDLLGAEGDIDVEAACHILHDLYIVRKILGFAKRIDANITEGVDTAELIGHAEEFVRGVASDSIKADTLKTIDEIVESSPNGINDFIDKPRDGIETPFETLNQYISGFQPGRLVIVGARPAVGKAQPLSSLIKLASGGWKQMGEIGIGDSLASVDGEASVVTGVFPQGKREVFKVTFSDGRVAECCEEHLWEVIHPLWDKPRVLSTAVIESILSDKEINHLPFGVPVFNGDYGNDSKLPLSPAVYGAMLQVNRDSCGQIASISKEYLMSSKKNRKRLLNSILVCNNDNYCDGDSSASLLVSHKHMANDIQDLARSIGWTCSIASDKNHEFILNIETTEDLLCSGWLPAMVRFASIERTGRVEKMQCISVSHPRQLYITDGFVVTHNTATLCQLAYDAAKRGRSVLFYSHEMWSIDIWTRIFCQEIGIRGDDFVHSSLSDQEKQMVKEFIQYSAARGLRVSDTGGRTPLSLRAELARFKAKYGNPDMVLIDYLQRMKCPNKSGNRFQEVSEISRSLKDMAMEFNTRMIVAAQVSRVAENRPGGDNRPQMSDLRESGDIEADADLIIFPHRPSLYWKKAGQPPPPDELIIAKNRQGRTGVIQMEYLGPFYKFVEKV